MTAVLDIPAFLDRRPLVWSFTLLHTYRDICPHQAAQRFIFKTVPFVETEAMRWGNEVHTAMEHRLGGKPLPLKMQDWEKFAKPFDGKDVKPEQKLGVTMEGQSCDFFAKNVWGRGKLDVPLVQSERAYLADWKTGNSKYENPFELKVQAVLLHARNPQLKEIKGQYIWLKENRPGKLYDLSDTRSTWNEIGTTYRQMATDRQAGHFEKRRGPLCAFCPVFDCEHNTNPDRK